jgi:hypothetical protein
MNEETLRALFTILHNELVVDPDLPDFHSAHDVMRRWYEENAPAHLPRPGDEAV